MVMDMEIELLMLMQTLVVLMQKFLLLELNPIRPISSQQTTLISLMDS